ncbi:uncharacterized protein LOC128238896 isoform X2 [Mya arenaria]|nr:uncharacterized protein LOC128238896 isoform X2 [Mya arenaria]XP_052811167.1 uncharacterized protein LOC128238896 isoform X2 [Mya arenaria]
MTMNVRPVMETAELRCYTNAAGRYPGSGLGARGSARDAGGMEGRGIILLVVCGLYAVFLFLAARAVSYAFSKITAPVRAVCFKRQITEAKVVAYDDNNNFVARKHVRQQPRTISHG